eukprot:3542114-Amphidinium_carterae.1
MLFSAVAGAGCCLHSTTRSAMFMLKLVCSTVDTTVPAVLWNKLSSAVEQNDETKELMPTSKASTYKYQTTFNT